MANILVHKSIRLRPELWLKARINAATSDCSLRDYISYLLEYSEPVEDNSPQADKLSRTIESNLQCRDCEGDA